MSGAGWLGFVILAVNPFGGLLLAIPYAVAVLHVSPWVAALLGWPLAYVQVAFVDLMWSSLARWPWWARLIEKRRTPRLERMASSPHMFWLVLLFGTVLGPWLVMAVMRYAKVSQRRIALPMALSIGWNAALIAGASMWAPLLTACGSPSTPAVTITTPSSSSASITPAPALTAQTSSRLCGRADKPHVAPDIAALIASKTLEELYEFPAVAKPPVEVIEGAAEELRDPNVRAAFERLDTNALDALRKAGAKWTLAAALGNTDVDVRIKAAHALGRLRDPAPASYMVEVARASAVFVPGSEAATLQGMFMHAIADAIGECTGMKIALRSGQDPEGLRAAADAWKKKICP